MLEVDMLALRGLAPTAREAYVATLRASRETFSAAGIATQLEAEHLLAQILHETGGLTIFEESLNYRTPERLCEVWPSRFPNQRSALPFVREPEALANYVYGRRMGNYLPGDGWRFRGRGMLQLTGREAYRKYGELLGLELLAQPELAYGPAALAIACAEFVSSSASNFAQLDDLVGVTQKVNGGKIGLGERRQWLARVREAKLIREV